MSTTKHTPGPWIAEHTSVRTEGEGSFRRIAYMEGNNPADEANARLIACAPDLLKALSDLCEAYRITPSGAEHHAYKQARAALAKATGGAE